MSKVTLKKYRWRYGSPFLMDTSSITLENTDDFVDSLVVVVEDEDESARYEIGNMGTKIITEAEHDATHVMRLPD